MESPKCLTAIPARLILQDMRHGQAAYLLKLPKMVEIDGILEDTVAFDQQVPFQKRFSLKSPVDNSYQFLYEAAQSAKNTLKLSLHILDDDTKIGLLRVDFSGQHQNPEETNDALPEELRVFAGRFFSHDEPHMHCHAEGYKSLAWAKPLDGGFPVRSIGSPADVLTAFRAFNSMIALKTSFSIYQALI